MISPIFKNGLNEKILIAKKNPKIVLIGDSIISNLTKQYPDMCVCNLLFPKNSLNLALPGLKIENLFFQIINGGIPINTKILFVHIGINNINIHTDVDEIISNVLQNNNTRFPF